MDDLADLFTRYPAPFRPSAAPEPLRGGGLSGARVWRVAAPAGALALKGWPGGADPAALERVHGWLAEVAGLGFIPVPIAGLDGRSVQVWDDRPWELSPWMPGAADPGRPPSPKRLRAGFAALATFHRGLSRHRADGPAPGLRARLRELEGLWLGGFGTLERQLDHAPESPECTAARRWLGLARRLAIPERESLRRAAAQVVPVQPCARDVRGEHLLFEGDRLTGLIDFGAMAPDCVAADLTRLLAEWVGPDPAPRAEALAAYESIRPLSPAESSLLPVYERSAALLGPGHWAWWHFVERRKFPDPSAVLSGLLRGLDRLQALAGAPGPTGIILETDAGPAE